MPFEGLGDRLRRLISPKPEAKATESEIHRPKSPWEILNEERPRDEQLAELIRSSFKPTHLIPGENKFVPLPDQNEGLYVCEPVAGEDGMLKSAIWLDPKKWQPTLDEFSELAHKFGDASLRLQLSLHVPGTETESILITPLSIEPSGTYRRSYLTFSLSSDGSVSIGNETSGYYDLGFLNPKRRHAEELALLMKEIQGQ